MRPGGYRVVFTADETMMSNYGGRLFLGFTACAPRRNLGPLRPSLLMKIIFRPVPSDSEGRAILAPHGLRRVEAALLESGVVDEDDLIVVHPKNLRRAIGERTRVILVSAIDPLGMGPASTTFAGPYGLYHEEPLNKWRFRELIGRPEIQRARRRGAVLMVGGPGAWQITEDVCMDYGIDVVVVGEGELVMPRLVKKALEGWRPERPLIVNVPLNETPDGDKIPVLRGATVGGLIEVSRGCGRGCAFCSATMRRLRHRPIEHILKDVEVNVRAGQRGICLHAEDILQYGGTPFQKRPEKVIELFTKVKSVPGVEHVGVSHISLSSIAEMPDIVRRVAEILELDERRWIGYQTGIETGSPRLIARWMRYKPYPFKPEEWPEVVVEAFGISNDNGLVPAATLILNLPGETEDDVLKTVELVDELKPYKSLIVPLLFVPMPGTPEARPRRLREDATPAYWSLLEAVWNHNVYWLPRIINEYIAAGPNMPRAVSTFIRIIVSAVAHVFNRRAQRMFERAKAAALAQATGGTLK